MTDKRINKWLRRRFSEVGWVLMAYYILMNLLAILGMALEQIRQEIWMMAAGDPFGQIDMGAVGADAWGYVATILVMLLILWAWKGNTWCREELLAREKRMRPGVMVCCLCFCVGAQMLNSLWVTVLELTMNLFDRSTVPLLESVSGSADTFSMFLYAAILAPIGEELLFRGYVLRSLRPFGKRFAILGSALLFGLFHGNLLQAPYAMLIGLVLGWLTVEYSVGWAVLLHLTNNLVLADLLSRLTASWSDAAYAVLDLTLFGGCAVASVVILVKKRREIKAYRCSEWIDRRCLGCFVTSPGILVLAVVSVYNMVRLMIL